MHQHLVHIAYRLYMYFLFLFFISSALFLVFSRPNCMTDSTHYLFLFLIIEAHNPIILLLKPMSYYSHTFQWLYTFGLMYLSVCMHHCFSGNYCGNYYCGNKLFVHFPISLEVDTFPI